MGDFVFLLFVFGAVFVLHKYQRVSAERFLREQLHADGLSLDELTTNFWTDGQRVTRYNFRARHVASGQIMTGQFVWRGFFGNHEVHFHDGGVRLRELRRAAAAGPTAGLAVEPDEGLDLEGRIRFEVNQRLERLQGDREAFLANDTNHDGIVDGAEWDAARARIEAEVRAEFEGSGPTPATITEATPRPAAAPAAEVQPIGAASEGDGHW